MKKTIHVILNPLQRFAIQKPNASILLFLATILAMLLANSSLGGWYNQILEYPIKLKIGNFAPFLHHGEPMTMLAFVNDALMAVFFFYVEIAFSKDEEINPVAKRVGKG